MGTESPYMPSQTDMFSTSNSNSETQMGHETVTVRTEDFSWPVAPDFLMKNPSHLMLSHCRKMLRESARMHSRKDRFIECASILDFADSSNSRDR